MKHILSKFGFLLAVALFVPLLADAHIGIGSTSGFWHGFSHPFLGFDHIFAMLATGVWAAQLGGRARWAVPATFVAMMIGGGILGMMGIGVPFVEQGILASVLILGLLIATVTRLPVVASILIVGLFAIFHGHAHGTEMPAAVSAVSYGLGFAVATALLHLGGIGLGQAMQKSTQAKLVRLV